MQTTSRSPVLNCFPPVIDRDTQILILGSFPGEASLKERQYYAHPRNQFWRLVSAVLSENLLTLTYPERLNRLLAHRIGLWDVVGACTREGSLDSAIRQAQTNDVSALKINCPQLSRICFNGKTSGKFAPDFAADGFDTQVLPSSSPANAQVSFDEKLLKWRGIIDPVEQTTLRGTGDFR
jgi:TDG/mug DNA glycosylase family protein